MRVTVSIPYFRCKATILKAVESILAQSYADLLVVVINDADNEPPWERLSDIKDNRLVFHEIRVNKGRYFCDAIVLEATTDSFILIQDGDDWSHERRVELLVEAIRSNEAIAAVSAIQRYRLTDGVPIKKDVWTFGDLNRPLDSTYRFRSVHHGLFRTSALLALGGTYAGFRIAYDTLLMNFLLMSGRVEYVPEPLYSLCRRTQSLTTSEETGIRSANRRSVHRQLQQFYEAVYPTYKQYEAGKCTRELLLRTIRAVRSTLVPEEEARLLLTEAQKLRIKLQGLQANC